MGNDLASIYRAPNKIDNYDTIVLIGRIVTSVFSLVYIPILLVFFSRAFTRVKVIQLQLIIISILHSFTFLLKGTSTQEFLCITKGMVNLLPYFSTITTETVIVYVALDLVWNQKDQRITISFFFRTFFFSLGIPLIYWIINVYLFYGPYADYNHPCWFNGLTTIIIFFNCCFVSFGINLGYLILSIIRMNKFIARYGKDEICVAFKKKLYIYLIWSLICFIFFLLKVIGFSIEYKGYVIRNFLLILVKYLFEVIRGPIYVVIYCYTKNTMSNFWTLLTCNRQKRNITITNSTIIKSDKEVALSESLNDGESNQDSNVNSTLY